MVKPPNLVKTYIDLDDGTVFADVGMPDLENVGFLLSSGIVIDGALVHSSLVSLDEDDHVQYSLIDGSRDFSGNISTADG